VLDVILTLHADHEFNASTFAARVAVATLADLHAAVVAAVATLKGPRHGGANEDVLAMLLDIGDPARAEAFVERRLAARAALTRQERGDPKARVPGFGHRVFFSAVVYDALSIPPDFCTSIFAVGRVAGWCAHALEQYADNRLIRPRAEYVGPSPRPLPAC
jgi:citrate synthase